MSRTDDEHECEGCGGYVRRPGLCEDCEELNKIERRRMVRLKLKRKDASDGLSSDERYHGRYED